MKKIEHGSVQRTQREDESTFEIPEIRETLISLINEEGIVHQKEFRRSSRVAKCPARKKFHTVAGALRRRGSCGLEGIGAI
jgi:hypothetical protein